MAVDLPRTQSGFIDFSLISCKECERLNYAQIFRPLDFLCLKCRQRFCTSHEKNHVCVEADK